MIHKVWEVKIVSMEDGVRERRMELYEFPVRATYYIESKFRNGVQTIKRRAIAMAHEDGIPIPVVSGMEWINHMPEQTP